MTLLVSMTLCGSLLLLEAEIIAAIFGKRLSGRVRYRMYKVVLAAYLLPIPYCKFIIFDFLYRICGINLYGLSLPVEMNFPGKLIVPTGERSYIVLTLEGVVLIVIPILMGTAFVIRRVIKYRRYRNAYLLDAEAAGFSGQDSEAGQSVPCYRSSLLDTPITMGIFKPKILFPLVDYDSEEFQMILAHETVHVKRKDNLWKAIMLAACAIHWYNPFIYLLYRRMDVCCELACDESVADRLHMDQETLKRYLMLLIRTATGEDGSLPLRGGISGLSYINEQKILEKRVRNMLNKKKSKKAGRILCLVLAVCFMMASVVSVWAYDAPNDHTYHHGDAKSEEYAQLDLDAEKVTSDSAMWRQTNEEMEFYKSLPFDECDTVCVDENGTVYPAGEYPLHTLHTSAETQALCFHKYTTYTMYAHRKNDSGGCTMTEYLCTKCVKCGYNADMTLIGQVKYVKCPH